MDISFLKLKGLPFQNKSIYLSSTFPDSGSRFLTQSRVERLNVSDLLLKNEARAIQSVSESPGNHYMKPFKYPLPHQARNILKFTQYPSQVGVSLSSSHVEPSKYPLPHQAQNLLSRALWREDGCSVHQFRHDRLHLQYHQDGEKWVKYTYV